jgi:hypothetical protein
MGFDSPMSVCELIGAVVLRPRLALWILHLDRQPSSFNAGSSNTADDRDVISARGFYETGGAIC